jgi:formylmethanofuran--tetrahydromethanopterin N-formyltransferase
MEPQTLPLELNFQGVSIIDTFAEAFPITGARVIVTAVNRDWVQKAAITATGHASSVIGCDTEAGIEKFLACDETPDGRPGCSLLFFAFSRDSLQKALISRVGQSILTCPTTAVYNGFPVDPSRKIQIGGSLRFFGDGNQISKLLDGRRYWRIPVMDGEFVCEDVFGTFKGVAGGNILILGKNSESALKAAELAVEAARSVEGVILPFPGGIVRSGSKVGSKYKKLKASTNDAFCPTLRANGKTELGSGVGAVYEIVIDGVDRDAVENSMRKALKAACVDGILAISAGNYGGKLGPVHIRLHDLIKS